MLTPCKNAPSPIASLQLQHEPRCVQQQQQQQLLQLARRSVRRAARRLPAASKLIRTGPLADAEVGHIHNFPRERCQSRLDAAADCEALSLAWTLCAGCLPPGSPLTSLCPATEMLMPLTFVYKNDILNA